MTRRLKLLGCIFLIFGFLNSENLWAQGVGILVNTGSADGAHDYYCRISKKLGLKPKVDTSVSACIALRKAGKKPPDQTTETAFRKLFLLLRHFGYPLTATDLELKSPAKLMSLFPNGQLLATRFFAPKIVDFNVRNSDAKYPYNAGWRKLVRIEPRAGSKAEKAGLQSAYILFNYVQKDPDKNPFPLSPKSLKAKIESFNTQVIVVPKTFNRPGQVKDDEVEDSAFFLDYGPRSKGYKISLALFAAFDTAPDPKNTKRDYFVPTSCAQCHGHDREGGGTFKKAGTFPFIKVNYLDTDHWYDMMSFGDFQSNEKGKFGVIFDGGIDQASAQYKGAVDVFRRLNEQIAQQNKGSIRPDKKDEFKVKAVEKWLQVHKKVDKPVAPIERALDPGGGGKVWQNSAADKHLLEQLDRYCFRCHSSILYDVFEKQAVINRRDTIIKYVQLGKDEILHMPQGRVLDDPTVDDLVKYLKNLK